MAGIKQLAKVRVDDPTTQRFIDHVADTLNPVLRALPPTALAKAVARYYRTTSQSIPATTFTTINFDTKDYDSDGAVTPGSAWRFAVPEGKGGVYRVSSFISMTASGFGTTNGELIMGLLKNGVDASRGNRTPWPPANGFIGVNMSASVKTVPGDALTVVLYQNPQNGSSQNTEAAASGITCWCAIEGPF